jgi:hypothetical protein
MIQQPEFNDDVTVSKIIGNITKTEIKQKQKLTHKRFDQYHKLYLKSIRKPAVKGQYKGTYLLMCKGCNTTIGHTIIHFESAKTIQAIRAIFDLHIDHDFILYSVDRVKKMSIRKLSDVKRVLAE